MGHWIKFYRISGILRNMIQMLLVPTGARDKTSNKLNLLLFKAKEKITGAKLGKLLYVTIWSFVCIYHFSKNKIASETISNESTSTSTK